MGKRLLERIRGVVCNGMRLLVPDSQKSQVREMRSSKYVIITSGILRDQDGIEAVELLFEDKSDEPFVLLISAFQCDRLLSADDNGVSFNFSVWTRGGMKLLIPARFRYGHTLPCLKAWGEL